MPSSSLSSAKAANCGQIDPVVEDQRVSMPPSVRNRPPSSCGRRSRCTSRTYHLGQAPFQEGPVARVHLECECIAVGRGRFVGALEPAEEIGSGGMEEVVAGQLDPLDQLEPELRPWAIATATARFSSTIGVGSSRASSS